MDLSMVFILLILLAVRISVTHPDRFLNSS